VAPTPQAAYSTENLLSAYNTTRWQPVRPHCEQSPTWKQSMFVQGIRPHFTTRYQSAYTHYKPIWQSHGTAAVMRMAFWLWRHSLGRGCSLNGFIKIHILWKDATDCMQSWILNCTVNIKRCFELLKELCKYQESRDIHDNVLNMMP
jgi:hypothetical protein